MCAFPPTFRFRMHEFAGQDFYLADLAVDICLESNTSCSHVQILNSTKLMKTACPWDSSKSAIDTGNTSQAIHILAKRENLCLSSLETFSSSSMFVPCSIAKCNLL